MKDVVSRCPIEEAMQVLSGRWPTLLLYYLKDGTKRFSELQRDNPTVSHRILSLELRKLEGSDIVRRTAHGGYPLHVDYSLTLFGLRLVPLIDSIGNWWGGRTIETDDDAPLHRETLPASNGSASGPSIAVSGGDRPSLAAPRNAAGVAAETAVLPEAIG